MSSGSSHYPSRNSKRDKLAECLVLVRRLTLSSFQILCHPPSNSSMRPYTWFKRCKSKLKHLIHLFTYHLPNLSSWTILYGSSPLWFCALWMTPCFFWCSQTCLAWEQYTAHDEQLSAVDETDVLQSICLNMKVRISEDFTVRCFFSDCTLYNSSTDWDHSPADIASIPRFLPSRTSFTLNIESHLSLPLLIICLLKRSLQQPSLNDTSP